MSNIVSREEQIRQGFISPPSTYLPARPSGSFDFQDTDRHILATALTAASDMMTHRQMTHSVRSDDTVVTQAFASLVYSAAYSVAAALITGGLIFLAWLQYGVAGEGGSYALLWLLLWGVSVLLALISNRAQGLRHSASGIAHHEIESRERLAMYTIDRHIELIERRWRLDRP